MELPTREVLVAFCVMLMAPALQLSPVLLLPSHANRLAHGRSNSHHGQVSQSHTSLLRHNAGDSPQLRHNAEGSSLLRHNAEGASLLRHNAGDSPLVRHNAGDSPLVRHNAGDSPLVRHNAGDSPLLRHNAEGSPLLRHNGLSSGTGIQRFANESSPHAKHLTDSVKQNASQKTAARANPGHSDFDFPEQGDVHNVIINDTDNGKQDSLDTAKSDITRDMKLNVTYGAKNTITTPSENNHILKRHSGSEYTAHLGASLDSSDILRSKRSFQIANDDEISQGTDRLKKLKMMYLESWLKENAPKDDVDNRLNTFPENVMYTDDSDVNVESAVSDTLSSPNSLDHLTVPSVRKHEEELTSKVYRKLLEAMQAETAYEHTYLVQLKARTMAQFAKQRLTLLRSVISPRESSLQDDKPLLNVWDAEVSENKVEASFAHDRSSHGSPGRDTRVEVSVEVPMDDLPQPHRWRDSKDKEQGGDSPIVLQTRQAAWSLVRRLHRPSQLRPLHSEESLAMAREESVEKQKKERLHRLLQGAQPLAPLDTTDTDTDTTDCTAGGTLTSAVSCPSDADTCLVDFMFCDGISDCPMGEDEEPSLCILRLWRSRHPQFFKT